MCTAFLNVGRRPRVLRADTRQTWFSFPTLTGSKADILGGFSPSMRLRFKFLVVPFFFPRGNLRCISISFVLVILDVPLITRVRCSLEHSLRTMSFHQHRLILLSKHESGCLQSTVNNRKTKQSINHDGTDRKQYSPPGVWRLVLLVLETRECSYSGFDPRLLIGAASVVDEISTVRRQVDPHDKVRRVSRRRQCPSSRQHLLGQVQGQGQRC